MFQDCARHSCFCSRSPEFGTRNPKPSHPRPPEVLNGPCNRSDATAHYPDRGGAASHGCRGGGARARSGGGAAGQEHGQESQDRGPARGAAPPPLNGARLFDTGSCQLFSAETFGARMRRRRVHLSGQCLPARGAVNAERERVLRRRLNERRSTTLRITATMRRCGSCWMRGWRSIQRSR